ncbi:Retinal guanylyl cyclase 1 [Sparganum proliferum]
MDEQLWTAPEILRRPEDFLTGSQKGDVYAFSIIMQEVISRDAPYGDLSLTASEIVEKIDHSDAPEAYITLMQVCWTELPSSRPTFKEILDHFNLLNKDKKLNIVDRILSTLDKYSADLEDQVSQRTAELREEQAKTEMLIAKMLPSSVAQDLVAGNQVVPEAFDETTIYFSDIVGFALISAKSTPIDIVNLLNSLYIAFDACIAKFDVYKVETIGDAYMVCSGLPIPNGRRHAGEIATMALELLSVSSSFVVQHMPNIPILLRIGIHSAFRIHVSPCTKVVLDELTGYELEFRGRVHLKGKGDVESYWLVGKTGFTKSLPEPLKTDGVSFIMEALKLTPKNQNSEPMQPVGATPEFIDNSHLSYSNPSMGKEERREGSSSQNATVAQHRRRE